MADKRKVEIVWGIKQDGMFLPFLTRSTRRQAIEDAIAYTWDSWDAMRRAGFTVHKLELRDAQ